MVHERRAALEKAQSEGRVVDYEGKKENDAAQIIQERFRGLGKKKAGVEKELITYHTYVSLQIDLQILVENFTCNTSFLPDENK